MGHGAYSAPMLTMLIQLLIICAIVGVLWWITTQIPMPAPIRIVANVVVGLIALVLLCGLLGWVPGVRLPR